MGGKIWLESEEGKGSTFHFTARFGLGADHTHDKKSAVTDLENVPVLVVDDNPTNRLVLAKMLSKWNMHVVIAESGAQALAEVEKAKGLGEEFQLVLTDCHMPEMDGFQLVGELRRLGMDNSIIMMLRSDDTFEAIAKCRKIGTNIHLTKPIKQSALLRSILHTLDTKSARSAQTRDSGLPAADKTLHVLLAEDNLVNQKVGMRMLEKQGHTVVVANDGVEAVSAWEKDSFDLILMDIQMPNMNGYETTASIRDKETHTGTHIPIIAMTAYAMKGDKERCIESGMDGYIAKPIRTEQMFAEIERVTRELARKENN